MPPRAGAPLVKAANWLSHVEFDWDSPVWRGMLREFSHGHQLVRYDERGCGLPGLGHAGPLVRSLGPRPRAVVDAAGLDRFPPRRHFKGASIAVATRCAIPSASPISSSTAVCARAASSAARPSSTTQPGDEQLAEDWVGGRRIRSSATTSPPNSFPAAPASSTTGSTSSERISTSPANAVRFMRIFKRDRRDRPASAGVLPDAGDACHARAARAVEEGSSLPRAFPARASVLWRATTTSRSSEPSCAAGRGRCARSFPRKRAVQWGAHLARARPAGVDRPGPRQRRDRRAVPVAHQDRPQPHHQYLRQARGLEPRAGDRLARGIGLWDLGPTFPGLNRTIA